MTSDPYAPHLRQADDLFAQGQIVKAGQIWQAILKQQPAHTESRERLLAVKQRLLALREAEAEAAQATPPEPPPSPALEIASIPEPHLSESEPPLSGPADARSTSPGAPLPVAPEQVITGALDPERLVAEGCTLYDMGQVGDALRKWEQALTLEPAHALARGYANGARRELGMPQIQAEPVPVPVREESHHADEDIDKLLREAVQLYDMGLVEEAITKWERAFLLDPQRHEIEGYLRQARTEVAAPAPGPVSAVPTHTASPGPDGLDLKLRQAEHLLTLQRQEEAAFTFQQALSLDPGNARALQGLERCRKPSPGTGFNPQPSQASVVTLDPRGRIPMVEAADNAATEPLGVEPPAALLKAAQQPRAGLSLPERLRETTERMPWLKDPRRVIGIGGGVLVVAVGFGVIHGYRKDQALKEEVRAARAAAVAPVTQQSQAPDLAEAPASIRQEAEANLGVDPLRAYLRAEAFVNRSAGDATGAQLLEKARAGLSGGVSGASLPEFQKHLQNGDLEAALRVMDALLRAQPDDADLRARAGRLHLVLCSAHASQAKWDAAQEDLLRGRALFPGDKSWQIRLRLLEHVKALPKNQQAAWISLLG
jgi:tetratricopeptide (TPR) repeat protein